ncbi:DUF3052 domain-containing protein [Nocardioides sp.]|uniref:DUF3052 domain-containing protein n=1 Tax=Nocardioides sp. TaxID=35761 RepID=UPI003527023A
MAGYSGTPLPRKLGVKDDHLVLLDGLPPGVDLGDLGAAEVVTRLPRRPLDLTVTFHTRLAPLRARLPALIERTAAAGMIWVCWPKKTARAEVERSLGVSCDLDENLVRALALELGVVDVKVAAIDEHWSGLKLVRRLVDR